jgi:acetyl esterase/lipase
VSALAEDRVVAGVPVRVFTPPDLAGVYLHLHGGGFVYGSARLQDDRLEMLARACRAAVISIEYRLAPEHPYPAAPDDCEAVAEWLAESATAQFGTDQLAIGGESAGAGLAVTTLVRLRDRHGFTGFRAAALAFGTYDLELSTFAEISDSSLRRDELDRLLADYAGTASRADPDLSPIHADLRDLPDALFVVGALDPLLPDSLSMCERWRDAGNGALCTVLPDSPHGVDASSDVCSFLAAHFDS